MSNTDRIRRDKFDIKDFFEKAAYLDKNGWEAHQHIDNWRKVGYLDPNGYWIRDDEKEYSIDEAYKLCKDCLRLSIEERDIVISLLEDELGRGHNTDEEYVLLKRLRGY